MKKRLKLNQLGFQLTQAVRKRWLYHSFVVYLGFDPSEGLAGQGERQVRLSNKYWNVKCIFTDSVVWLLPAARTNILLFFLKIYLQSKDDGCFMTKSVYEKLHFQFYSHVTLQCSSTWKCWNAAKIWHYIKPLHTSSSK